MNYPLLHKDELSSILFEKGIHIMALNETRLDKMMPKNLLDIKTYKLKREDRNRHGGGVAVYIKDNIKYTRWAGLGGMIFPSMVSNLFA